MALLVARSGPGFIVGGNSAIRAWHEIRSNAAVNLKKKKIREKKKVARLMVPKDLGFPSRHHLWSTRGQCLMSESSCLAVLYPVVCFPGGNIHWGRKEMVEGWKINCPLASWFIFGQSTPVLFSFTWNVSWTCCFNMRQSAGLSEECPWRLKTASQ